MKQAIIFRTDLKLGKGKLAAHAAHAALVGYQIVMSKQPTVVGRWMVEGQKKIVLKVKDFKELRELYKDVKSEIPSELISDAGLTQIKPGTVTCLVIGPWADVEIDKFTKKLKLL